MTVAVQRDEARSKANSIRLQRHDLRASLRDSTVQLADVLSEPDWFISSLLVYELLLWAPKVGLVKASSMLRRADVWPLREVGKLTRNQKDRLLAETRR